MITTDQKNNGNLGETRTFSVHNHSAEGMKNEINAGNESSLSAKNRAHQTAHRTASGAANAARVHNTAGGERPRNARAVPTEAERRAHAEQINRQTASARTEANQVRRETRNTAQNIDNRAAQNNTAENRQLQPAVRNMPKPQSERKPAAKAVSAEKTAPVTLSKTMNTTVNTGTTKKEPEKTRVKSDEGGNTVLSIVKAIVYIIFVIIISVFFALGIILVGNDVFAFVKSDEVVEVTIPEYATLDQVSQILYENDIIKYPDVFKLYAVYKKDNGEFLPGTYSVNGMMNYDTLLGEFKEKIVFSTIDVTIPEGYTTDEIIDLFVNQYGIGTREGFIDVIQNYDFDYWFIDELEQNGRMENRIYRLDGYLFPDTYQFYTSTSEVTVIGKMLKRFSQIFTKEYRNQCAEFGYSVDEMITLASMIEREAASPSEFFLVSSVFHNRLNNRWNFPRLESDATVLYVLRHESGEKITLTADDLKYDTPYNTYMYEGLPPGPIANPSASAMLAALSPQTTNYYYFVANKGKTYFSETKAQHDAYIEEFRNETAEQQTTGDVPQN